MRGRAGAQTTPHSAQTIKPGAIQSYRGAGGYLRDRNEPLPSRQRIPSNPFTGMKDSQGSSSGDSHALVGGSFVAYRTVCRKHRAREVPDPAFPCGLSKQGNQANIHASKSVLDASLLHG
jgi:hypothetical protein